MSQSITWLSPCTAGTVTRTVVHFFPSSGGIGAPYPAHCKLTLIGSAAGDKSVVLEGARLSQPDGLWLDDAFPELQKEAGFCSVLIELSTPQPRVDITTSGCVVELHSPNRLSRFWPVMLNRDGSSERRGALPLIQDPFQTTSILVVNASKEEFKPSALGSRMLREGKASTAPLSLPHVAARTSSEVPVPSEYIEAIAPQQCGFGLMRLASVELTKGLPDFVAVYLLYRDAATQYPVSVCAL